MSLFQSLLCGMGSLNVAVAVCFVALSLLFMSRSLFAVVVREAQFLEQRHLRYQRASLLSPSAYVAGTSVSLMWLPLSSCGLVPLAVILVLPVIPSSSESNTIHLLRLLRRGETSGLAGHPS